MPLIINPKIKISLYLTLALALGAPALGNLAACRFVSSFACAMDAASAASAACAVDDAPAATMPQPLKPDQALNQSDQ